MLVALFCMHSGMTADEAVVHIRKHRYGALNDRLVPLLLAWRHQNHAVNRLGRWRVLQGCAVLLCAPPRAAATCLAWRLSCPPTKRPNFLHF